jgi:hypothetical protein
MLATKVKELFGVQTTHSAVKDTVSLGLKLTQTTQTKKKGNLFWNNSLTNFASQASYEELQQEVYGKSYRQTSAKTKMQPYYNKLELLKKYGTAKMTEEQNTTSSSNWWSFKFLKKFLVD